MDLSQHPVQFIMQIATKQKCEFTFSKYRYEPDSLVDEREIFQISSAELNAEWLEDVIANLENRQELALHSTVIIANKRLHIPMIDFAISSSQSDEMYDRLVKFIPKRILTNMVVYDSGRSLHAYSATLLKKQEWIDFMGRLLLVNPKDGNEIIVDSRWIGHRLMGGFSALRWSNNTGLYLAYPSKVKYP